jgi:hypothetical protein
MLGLTLAAPLARADDAPATFNRGLTCPVAGSYGVGLAGPALEGRRQVAFRLFSNR